MSDQMFGEDYAEKYDFLYYDKDYASECDLLEKIFQRYCTSPVQTILDLGCGTGNHAIPLVRRGYHVTGVDLSPGMLAHAKRKAAAELEPVTRDRITFVQGDARSVDLGQCFDAVLMMFAVLGYQTSNDHVLAALRTARRHLRPRGILVCDLWYGPAVLAIHPSDRVKVISLDDGQLIRIASPSLDTRHHLCKVGFHMWHLKGEHVISETREEHTLRYFFPMEIESYLSWCDLSLRDMFPIQNPGAAVDETTWNVLVVARNDTL